MWVDLLQDAAIVALSVAQIGHVVGTCRRETRLSAVEKTASGVLDSLPPVPLMDTDANGSQGDGAFRRVAGIYGGVHYASEMPRNRYGLHPEIFSAGDEVLVDGFEGVLELTGFDNGRFEAVCRDAGHGMGTTVGFEPDKVRAWRRTNGEWPVNWFHGSSQASRNVPADARHGARKKSKAGKQGAKTRSNTVSFQGGGAIGKKTAPDAYIIAPEGFHFPKGLLSRRLQSP